ncbi:MAG TPA: CTP-dependent riboflavin kinase [Methanobacteriaceae archaeon]|nr:CTP-dependent riboflavin kinase [Methanobacteriaceae archaeon]
MKIQGEIISGDNKGQYFMSLDIYKIQFMGILGFEPFPGTLNLKIDAGGAEKIGELMEKMDSVKGRGKFGDVKLIKARLDRDFEGALVFPVKTHHEPDVLEFISPLNLRKSLQLQDGDHVILEIFD